MKDQLLGLHHVTAIASSAKQNLDFYTDVLGVRLVKKTVNFDDPGTYHFYYGNEAGEPGTVYTFFPWEGARRGSAGAGQATDVGYAIDGQAYDFWKERFTEKNVAFKESELFGEQRLSIQDPDGLRLHLNVPQEADDRQPWTTHDIQQGQGLKGFHHVRLTLNQADPTIQILTDIFGYTFHKQEGNVQRFKTDAIATANLVDVEQNSVMPFGRSGAGTNHHIAFRVKDDEILMNFREKILSAGWQITPKIDRNYFFSLYFREPGGVLFELASDNPGFTADEILSELGTQLKLPAQYENRRDQITNSLPKL